MSGDELDRVLEAHGRWLASGGVEGRRAVFGRARPTRPYVTEDGRVVQLPTPRPAPFAPLLRELRARGFRGLDLRSADFAGADLSHAELEGARLEGALFRGADLRGARLDGAPLAGADLTDVLADGASLRGAALDDCRLPRASLRGASLGAASLQRAVLIGADLTGCVLANAVCSGAVLASARLTEADGSGGRFEGTNWEHASARRCILSGADLTSAVLPSADLSEARLDGATLDGADLRSATLRRAGAAGARAADANFSDADLRDANLAGAHLVRALFRGADLEGADLRSADLGLAELTALHRIEPDPASGGTRIRVKEPSLARVRWEGAGLASARLDRAAAEQVPHPVLHRFRGTLRIEGQAMKKLQVFICHAHEDAADAGRIYDLLVEEGFAPWMDKRDLQVGDLWERDIPMRIREAGAVIVCLSRLSLQKAGYVNEEIRLILEARRRMPLGRIFIFPVRLDECAIPPELAEFQWLDLWRADSLRDLASSLRRLE